MDIKIDLSKKVGSIGYVMVQNRDAILSVKGSDEAYGLLKRLFEESKINTPKSRQILYKLQQGMAYANTLIYLNNIIMKSQMMGV